MVEKFGLWKRIVVDYGKEFFLTLYMHQYLHGHLGYVDEDRVDSTYKQTKSTRVSLLPLKSEFVDMERV